MSDQQNVFLPMETVSLGECVQRAARLYLSQLGWFVGTGLLVSIIQASVVAATAGWAMLLGLLVLVPANMALVSVAYSEARGESLSGDTILEGFRRGPAYALGMLESLILVIGFLFAIVPGFLAIVALTWATIAMFRDHLPAVDAVKQSFALTRDHPGLTIAMVIAAFALESLATGTIVAGAITLPLLVCLKVVVFEQIVGRR